MGKDKASKSFFPLPTGKFYLKSGKYWICMNNVKTLSELSVQTKIKDIIGLNEFHIPLPKRFVLTQIHTRSNLEVVSAWTLSKIKRFSLAYRIALYVSERVNPVSKI